LRVVLVCDFMRFSRLSDEKDGAPELIAVED
jgi:hypothetical protein